MGLVKGAKGGSLLSVEVPENVMAEHEWIQEGKPYREFLMPAAIANNYLITLLELGDPAGMRLLKKRFFAGDITAEEFKIQIKEFERVLEQKKTTAGKDTLKTIFQQRTRLVLHFLTQREKA